MATRSVSLSYAAKKYKFHHNHRNYNNTQHKAWLTLFKKMQITRTYRRICKCNAEILHYYLSDDV